MVFGGMSCVKYLLFCFNLLFALSGIAILTVGCIAYGVYGDYSHFVYSSFQLAPIVLIVVGVIIFIVAFFGCCGAVKENHCMIITFSLLLLVIFILELTAGIIGYVKRSEVEVMLDNKLNATMYQYYTDENVRKTWNIAQHEAECCGMKGPEDWRKITKNDTLPNTCCPNTQANECTLQNPRHYKTSCIVKFKAIFNKYGLIIGSVGIGIAASQLIGIIFACCLARSIRKEYETV